MKDFLIIQNEVIHINFFGFIVPVHKQHLDYFIALDGSGDVYVYSNPPVKTREDVNTWYVPENAQNEDYAMYKNTVVYKVIDLSYIADIIPLDTFYNEIGKRYYKVSDFVCD